MAFTKKEAEAKQLSVNVHGFEIKSDSLYKVIPKLDSGAPDGFIQHDTTKLLDPHIGTEVPMAIWDNDRNIWDTGLHENSKTLIKLYPDTEARKTVIAGLKKFIIDPVERIIGEGRLSHIDTGENCFWLTASTDLRNDITFNTSNPMQLLSIYSAVLFGNLAPKDKEEDTVFRLKAQYAVQNIDEVLNLGQRKDLERNKAIGLFFTMYSQNKTDLITILDYLGIPSSNNPDEAALNSAFTQWLNNKENGYQNAKIFLETYENFSSISGKQELTIFSKLKQLLRDGVIKRKMGSVYLGDTDLGANLKIAARKAAQSSEIQELIFDHLKD